MAYRHDIDGLRGLAIALVVVFHIWMGRVSGGVDVFLALSGFFFLGSLLRGADNPNTPLNPVPHVKRLVRRLYPALLVTVFATVVGTLLIKPPAVDRDLRPDGRLLLYYWELIHRLRLRGRGRHHLPCGTCGRCRFRGSSI